MPRTRLFKVTLTCCCLCFKCCSLCIQPDMAILQNQRKAFNLVIYKMMKTGSDHILKKPQNQTGAAACLAFHRNLTKSMVRTVSGAVTV